MTASYSASLLEAWNPNLNAYSMSIPSGEVRSQSSAAIVNWVLHSFFISDKDSAG